MNEIVIRVLAYSQQKPFGFTLDIQTFQEIEKGISVAFKETQSSFGKEGLEKVVEHAQVHDNKVGGWLNTDDDQYYFDSVKIFFDLEQAIRFAIENNQEAIYYIDLKLEIKVKR